MNKSIDPVIVIIVLFLSMTILTTIYLPSLILDYDKAKEESTGYENLIHPTDVYDGRGDEDLEEDSIRINISPGEYDN